MSNKRSFKEHSELFTLGAICILLCLTASLTGCGRAQASRKDIIELSIWSMWSGPEEQNFLRVLRRYEELHPNIHIKNLGAVSDDTKTIRALVAGVPPDLCTLSDASYLGPLARNQAVLSMDKMFQESGLKSADFVPSSLNLCRYKNKLYGLPFLIDDEAMLWNKQAFREAGLDPDRPPKTLEELAEYAVKLTKRDSEGKITRLGLRPPPDYWVLMALFGGRLIDPVTGKITPDDPGNAAGLKWYKGVVDRVGGFSEVNAFASGFGRDASASNPFYTGKVAIMFNGEWNPYWISRYAPQLDYGVAPIPAPAACPQNAGTTWLGGNVFCIPTESRHPKEAWDFLVWAQTEEAQVMFAKDMNNVPNQLSAIRSPKLRTGPPFRAKYSIYLDLADGPKAKFFPALPATNLYSSQMITSVDKIMLGDLTAENALAGVRVRVQKEMDK